MKLVDILARELKVWPDQYYQIYQDSGGHLTGTLSNGDLEDCDQEDLPFDPVSIAWDGNNAVVDRAEWQAAVDAPNTPKVVEWDGVGLPPVGAVCAVLNSDLGNPAWERCTILYSGKHRVMYDSESCEERVAFIENLTFRKARTIRTAEQVAAEEQERFIDEMAIEVGITGEFCTIEREIYGRIYSCGYRKQVTK